MKNISIKTSSEHSKYLIENTIDFETEIFLIERLNLKYYFQ